MSGGYGYEVRRYNNTAAATTPVAENWKKMEYTESDHVVPSSETYLIKSERIIEKVHSPTPTVIEYVNVTPVVKYGVQGNRLSNGLSSRIDDRPKKVEEFITQVQTEVSSPPHLLRPSTHSSPGFNYNHSSEYLRPQETDRWSRSSSPISSPMSTAEYGGKKSTWGGGISPLSEVRETETTNRSALMPGYLSNTYRTPLVPDSSPKLVTTENNPWVRNSPRSPNWPRNWAGPVSPGNWATTTTTKIRTLCKPTNDIKEAVSYLAGSLQQSSLKNGYNSPQQQYYNTLGHTEMEQHYEDVIDSREVQSRYGDFNGVLMGRDGYGMTIDSREALRKYGGAAV